jgi:predicted dehydrogenase
MQISRREFTRLGAMGLAAGAIPGMEAQTGGARVGYCIIGLGEIANHFMAGIQQSEHCKITGLVSGHRDKAEQMAAKFGVPKESIYSYEDMDRMRDNKAIDAVYVALPNSMHAEYTIRSAKAGKHVLCEKPMCVTVEEGEAMIAACKAANVKLMIAYRCQYEPLNLQSIQMIRSGAIGEVQSIESAFGFNIQKGVWRTDKKLAGGGSLLDVGIYSLNATRYLTGEEPAEFRAFVSTRDHDGRFEQIEENVSWVTKFPSGILASCSTTYGANMPGFFRVNGSKGWLGMEPAFSYEGLRLRASLPGNQEIDKSNPEKDPTQFQREADHFAECVRENRTPKTPGEEGLRDIRHIFAIYRAAGVSL